MQDDVVNLQDSKYKSFKLRQAEMERKLDNHIIDSRNYREVQQMRQDRDSELISKLLKAQETNTLAITQLTTDVTQLTAATAGVIEVYAASQGAIKVGGAIGRFIKWIGGVGAIVATFVYAWVHGGNPPAS